MTPIEADEGAEVEQLGAIEEGEWRTSNDFCPSGIAEAVLTADPERPCRSHKRLRTIYLTTGWNRSTQDVT